MSNNKQTSIDWLFEQMTATWYDVKSSQDIIEQAKAMHKEEIENAWYNGYLHQGEMFEHECVGEQFYNETFGGKNEQQ